MICLQFLWSHSVLVTDNNFKSVLIPYNNNNFTNTSSRRLVVVAFFLWSATFSLWSLGFENIAMWKETRAYEALIPKIYFICASLFHYLWGDLIAWWSNQVAFTKLHTWCCYGNKTNRLLSMAIYLQLCSANVEAIPWCL